MFIQHINVLVFGFSLKNVTTLLEDHSSPATTTAVWHAMNHYISGL